MRVIANVISCKSKFTGIQIVLIAPKLNEKYVIITILIVVVGFSQMFGQKLLEDNPEYSGETTSEVATSSVNIGTDGQPLATDSDSYGSNVMATLVHPKVLGMIILLIVGIAAILLITKTGFIKHQ